MKDLGQKVLGGTSARFLEAMNIGNDRGSISQISSPRKDIWASKTPIIETFFLKYEKAMTAPKEMYLSERGAVVEK